MGDYQARVLTFSWSGVRLAGEWRAICVRMQLHPNCLILAAKRLVVQSQHHPGAVTGKDSTDSCYTRYFESLPNVG